MIGFFAGAAVVSAIAYFSLHSVGLEHFAYPLMGLTALLCLWCVWFFRDPARRIPAAPGTVVSPADGVVCLMDSAPPPPELGLSSEPMARVCVFMNVINVHVNRAPIAGTVERVEHRAGTFLNASLDKASEDNERLSMLLRLPDGRAMAVVQIAGLVARRIVCRVAAGVVLKTGERYGLIRFGSRVDVYFPKGVEPVVKVGMKTVAGETVLAMMPGA
ncbi:phosphatidylserine decarboxylase [Phycisphaerales bacterium]|nr:phosphatidylserine decarboxylase [Phycisphaerales bacterium]